MFKNLFIGAAAFLLLMSTVAKAEIVFNPSAFYYMRDDDGTNSNARFTQQITNLKLGYLDSSGLYLGIAYDMESRQYNSSTVSDEDRKSTGATIGYESGGWSILGTYYFTSELEAYDGNGWTADLGYVFNMGSIGIGPLLSYRHWEYDKKNGASVNPKVQQVNFLPSIQFQFVF
jgi:hypothetical protein